MKNIITTATDAGSFTKLVAAIKAAGLTDALNADGPFTVFAPNDDAFGKLPHGSLDGLLKDVPKLTSILKYHVVPGKVMAKDVLTMDGKTATTLHGADLTIATAGGVRLNKSHKVSKTDIECTNGVIHIVDQVLMPPLAVASAQAAAGGSTQTIAQAAAGGSTQTSAQAAAGGSTPTNTQASAQVVAPAPEPTSPAVAPTPAVEPTPAAVPVPPPALSVVPAAAAA